MCWQNTASSVSLWNFFFLARGHVKPASQTLIRCTDIVYDICGQNSFLILSGVQVLHIFKKSLAIRATGEQLFSGDRTGSKLSSFYFCVAR